MPTNVTCPKCTATLRVPETAAGKKVKCPKCAAICAVPAAATGDDAAVAAEATRPVPRKSKGSRDDLRPQRQDDESLRDAEDDEDDASEGPRRQQGAKRRKAKGRKAGKGWQFGLGVAATVLGAIALAFSFIPCLGLPFALGFGVLGLAAGGAGITFAIFAGRRGVALPAVGSGLSVLALVIGVGWYMLAASWAQTTTSTTAAPVQNTKKPNVADAGTPLAEIRAKSVDNLKKLIVGMANVHDVHGRLPPARVGAGAKPGQLSWRVAMLPFVGEERLYEKFKLDEPWNSPHNKDILDTVPMPAVFASPRAKPGEEKKTYYQVFTGPKTLFPDDGKRMVYPGSFSDNPAETFLIVEAQTPVFWTEPVDLPYDGANVPPLGGIFDGDFHAATATFQDATVVYIRSGSLRQETLKALITPAGGEKITEKIGG